MPEAELNRPTEILDALLSGAVPQSVSNVAVDKIFVDQMIAEIDRRVCRQIDAILHHPEFQKLEAAWRSLKFLVDRTPFHENIRLSVVSISRDELIADFEDSPEVLRSGLFRIAYTQEYGQFGGTPYGAIVGNYEFGPNPQDLALLQKIAGVAAMAHAPFIAAAGPQFFGLEDYRRLPAMDDLKSTFEGPQYAKWRSLRQSEDARYIGLTMPRFLLRTPYRSAMTALEYDEETRGSHLWGNAAFAFATRLGDSFAKYRWCPHIVGVGGVVEKLPHDSFDALGPADVKIPTEVLITERMEFELSEQGFIPMTARQANDDACFLSANSVQMPKAFSRDKAGRLAETNYRLGMQLPYLFIVCRLAHYLKVIQREHIGSWKERVDLEMELNRWLQQYVADMDNPVPGIRSRRPLREAQVVVDDIPGNPGLYRVLVNVRPHLKYMGAFFTLSLVGRMDKEAKG